MYPNIEAKVRIWNCEEEIKDPTTLISLARRFKGGWKEGLVCGWREMNVWGQWLLFWRASSALCEISGKGVTSFPVNTQDLQYLWQGGERAERLEGRKQQTPFFCLCVSHHADFCCFHSCCCSFPRAALLPPFPEAVVSLILTFGSHVGGEPGCTEAAVNLAVAWTKHSVEWKSPGA